MLDSSTIVYKSRSIIYLRISVSYVKLPCYTQLQSLFCLNVVKLMTKAWVKQRLVIMCLYRTKMKLFFSYELTFCNLCRF
jgi:hypothetical protein